MFENLAHHPDLNHVRAENLRYADLDRNPETAEIVAFDVVQEADDGQELARDTLNSYDLVGYALSPESLEDTMRILNRSVRARTVRLGE